MATLQHAVKIRAPRAEVYGALATLDGMRRWHLGVVDGAIAPGAVLRLTPRAGLQFAWRTERLEEPTRIVQTCVEGPGHSVGKTLTISVTELQDGRTLVQLSDGAWPADDPDLPICNTRWGEALGRLRDTLEAPAK